MNITEREKFKSQLGFEVRKVREKLGITQSQLGDCLNLDSTYISKIERGIKPIPINSLFELLSVCNEEFAGELIMNVIEKVKEYDCYNGKNW